MDEKLINEFHNKMEEIYYNAKREVKYNATIFFRMVNEHRGYGAAKRLLAGNDNTDGLATLIMLGRKDLTMEYLILENEKFHCLFTSDELQICRERLGRV